MTSSNLDFNEALEKYYKLKKKYEAPYKKLIKNLASDNFINTGQEDKKDKKNKEKEKKEKQLEIATFKNKCVKCGSLAGTIFKQENNILTAECGNEHNKCKLNIKLQKGVYDNIVNIIDKLTNDINIKKTQTIQAKLNFLFGFNNESDTIEEFNKLKLELIDEVKKYQNIYEHYLSIINNLSQKKEIKKKEEDINTLIKNFKKLINTFEETQEIIHLKEANDLYINNIKTIANELRDLKYVYSYVNKDDKKNIYELIQDNYNLTQLQILVPGTENRIIDYKV